MLTIKDIAKIANVSVGTVDRVLHKRSGVSKKTEEKVNEILKQNDFKLNPIARTLALRTKYNLSCLMPSFNEENLFWRYPYMGIKKAEEELLSSGIETNIFSFDQFDSKDYLRQFDNLLDEKPDAVILVPAFYEETKPIAAKLEELDIPYIFLNIRLEGFNNISFLGQDSYQGGYTAGKLMNLYLNPDSSCVTISIKSNPNTSNNKAISNRIRGFDDFLNKENKNIQNHMLEISDLDDEEQIKYTLNKFMENNKSIEGIFVPSSRVYIIVNSIKEKYLKGLCVIAYDTTENNIKCLKEDKVTFIISQKSFNQGYKAVHTITDLLIHKKEVVREIFSPIQVIMKENIEYCNSDENSFITRGNTAK